MKKLIFLDVDGVLNSIEYIMQSETLICMECVERLSRICLPDAEIILCSTWKELYEDKNRGCKELEVMISELERSLAAYGMKISDMTGYNNKERPYGIYKYLQEHNYHDGNAKFVILDDDFSRQDYDKYHLGSHLVQTRYFAPANEGGLQEKHVEKALSLLS